MNLEPNRDIQDLDPVFRDRLVKFLNKMAEIGEPMAAHETLRTQERQDYLYSTGKSKVDYSTHQDGVAADLHFTTGVAFPPQNDDRWYLAANTAKEFGIDCGLLLWNWDSNHFQINDEWTEDMTIKHILKEEIEANSALWHLIKAQQNKLNQRNNKLRDFLKKL